MKAPGHKWFTLRALSRSEANIYLYGSIEESNEVNANDFAIQLNEAEKVYPQINIHINSPGGSIFEGLAIYNLIKNSKANIDTYVDGMAASMGSVLAMAGKRVYMSRNARLMIHEPQWGDYTTADSLRKMADLMDGLKDDIARIYSNKTGKGKQWIINNWMSDGRDNWFSPEEAKAAGLIDEIFENDAKNPGATLRDIKSIAAHYSGLSVPSETGITEYERLWRAPTFYLKGKETSELALLKESDPSRFKILQAEFVGKLRAAKAERMYRGVINR